MDAVDSQTFLDHLKQSRLLTEEQLLQVGRIAEGVPVTDLPAALVEDGILTPMQALRIARGDFRSLVLGPYHILEEIGRGGMGRVYKAIHTVMGRVVALKLMSPDMAEDPPSRERFLREVRSVTRLSHPNIVLAFDANEADGVLFLAMEYVDGMTLAETVRSGGPLAVSLACEVMRQAALGLQHAHQKGLVHRDIKPANMLIPKTNSSDSATCIMAGAEAPSQSPALVKIADFGLARLHGLHGTDTVGGQTGAGVIGTPDYVSPEQCMDARTVDIRSDLYSLGCTFFYVLTGHAPFAGETAFEKMFAHVNAATPRVEEERRDVPPAVAKVVARLMEKDPGRRFQTPTELALALAPWCTGFVAPAVGGNGRPAANPDATATRVMELPSAPTPPPWSSVMGGPGYTADRTPDAGATPLIQPDRTPRPPSVDASFVRTPTPDLSWESNPELDLAAGPSSRESLRPIGTHSPEKAVPDPLPVVDPAGPAATLPLSRSLPLWVRLVEGLARRPGVTPDAEEAYRALHRAVVEGCSDLSQGADEETRARLRRLADLVRPWVSASALARTEADLLRDLAARVSEAGRGLGLEVASRSRLGWLVALFVLALALPLGARASRNLTAGQETAQRKAESLWRFVSGVFVDGPIFWVSLCGMVGILLVLWRLSRRRL